MRFVPDGNQQQGGVETIHQKEVTWVGVGVALVLYDVLHASLRTFFIM
jgi:hypothetical protein